MDMENKKESQRVKETKSRIQNAFLELLQKKPVEEITVREITERAQMNRTSFYRYYLDVYDLYEQLADVFAEQFQKTGMKLLPNLIQGQPVSFQDTAIAFWMEHQEIMKIYLQDSKLLNKVKAKNILYFKNLLGLNNETPELDFILEFYVSGQIGLITYWMQHPGQMNEDGFFALMHRMIFHGPLTVLKEKIPQEVFSRIEGDAVLLGWSCKDDENVMKK